METKYYPNQSSITPTNVLILTGLMATQFLNSPMLGKQDQFNGLGQSSYSLEQSSSTVGQQNYLLGSYEINDSDKEFVETVSRFYAGLSAKQEPLGTEFEKVLNENLWDLYGS